METNGKREKRNTFWLFFLIERGVASSWTRRRARERLVRERKKSIFIFLQGPIPLRSTFLQNPCGQYFFTAILDKLKIKKDGVHLDRQEKT